MMLLAFLVGGAVATLPDKCIQGEHLANGRFTGQNIDMNYEASEMLIDGTSGKTQLRVQFFVPRRYTEAYELNAFAVTFNRKLQAEATTTHGDWRDDVLEGVLEGTSEQKACYSNRYDNYTYCKTGGDNLWTIEQNPDNECMSDAYALINWEDVMGDAFSGRVVRQNGRFTEVFLAATVETWTHFDETTDSTYVGQMTGSEQWLNKEDDANQNNRQGTYGGDGGWTGAGDPHSGNFPALRIDDERYTLYQIPFILRFPRSVVVETTFKAASDITVLTAVIGQDTIQVDKNPTAGGNFAVLEAVITTQVQYPYAIRGPDDNDETGNQAGMQAYVGDDYEGSNGEHAASIEIIEHDQQSACGGTGVCTQTFKVRITPAASNRCSVAGNYFFEFWAVCQNGGQGGTEGCTVDDKADSSDPEVRRSSNAYFSHQVAFEHQEFCPILMDEVRVVGDLRVFHDESFKTQVTSTSVFTNDVLFYEAEYRTASASATNDFENFESNDFDGSVVGNDDIIDYVRATKIFMDVTIGQGSDDSATAGWDSTNWDSNFDFTENGLGGTRIPNSDIAGSDITITNGSGDYAEYKIVLCEGDDIDADEIMFEADKPVDCFTGIKETARDFLDFEKVMSSSAAADGSDNTIDENEVAFEMRMDERIIPLKPGKTDGSHVTVTIEAEVYYKGNRHATRRLLQADPSGLQKQKHSMSAQYGVQRKQELSKCTVAPEQAAAKLTLDLAFDSEKDMPSASGSLDWAARLSMQLDGFLGRGSVSVSKAEKCNVKGCMAIYSAGHKAQRRLDGEATHMKVELEISSTKNVRAGVTVNKLQDQLMSKQSELFAKVTAFDKAEVSKMSVEGCNDGLEGKKKMDEEILSTMVGDEESSAAALSFASLLGLWMLL